MGCKWYRNIRSLPDGSYLWYRGLDNSAYHYVGEDAEIIALVLRYSK